PLAVREAYPEIATWVAEQRQRLRERKAEADRVALLVPQIGQITRSRALTEVLTGVDAAIRARHPALATAITEREAWLREHEVDAALATEIQQDLGRAQTSADVDDILERLTPAVERYDPSLRSRCVAQQTT